MLDINASSRSTKKPFEGSLSLKIDRKKVIAREYEDRLSFFIKSNATENVIYIEEHPARCNNGSFRAFVLYKASIKKTSLRLRAISVDLG